MTVTPSLAPRSAATHLSIRGSRRANRSVLVTGLCVSRGGFTAQLQVWQPRYLLPVLKRG